MSVWGRMFAAGYDHMMAGPETATLRTHREALIPHAKGQVLEIGGGTGTNLPFYKGVEMLTLTEPDNPMVRRLERRLRERSPAALLLRIGCQVVMNLLGQHCPVHQRKRTIHLFIGLQKRYAAAHALQRLATLAQMPPGGILLLLRKAIDFLLSLANPFLIPIGKPGAETNRIRVGG